MKLNAIRYKTAIKSIFFLCKVVIASLLIIGVVQFISFIALLLYFQNTLVNDNRIFSYFLQNSTIYTSLFIDIDSIDTYAYNSFGEIRIGLREDARETLENSTDRCRELLLQSLCPEKDHLVWTLRYPQVNTFLDPPRISLVLQQDRSIFMTYWCNPNILPDKFDIDISYMRRCLSHPIDSNE